MSDWYYTFWAETTRGNNVKLETFRITNEPQVKKIVREYLNEGIIVTDSKSLAHSFYPPSAIHRVYYTVDNNPPAEEKDA